MKVGRHRVLVVDDDQDYLELLQTWLQELDLDVCATTSGHQAIRLLSEDAFDAMLVDVVMPVLDGLEVIRAARQRYPDMPIIALSGGGKRITAALATSFARSGGSDAELYKPVDPDDLKSTVRCLLGAA